jgi:hypothetical protein
MFFLLLLFLLLMLLLRFEERAGLSLGWHCFLRFFLDPIVSFLLELEGEFLVAAQFDPAPDYDVHVIGNDVVQKPLVMGDQKNSKPGTAQRINSVGDNL